jgi:hypothetical protein
MAEKSATAKEWLSYWSSAFRDAWKSHKFSPYYRGPSAAMIAAALRWRFGTGVVSAADLIELVVYAFVAYFLLWLFEFGIRLIFISPVNANKNLSALLEQSKTKLEIGRVFCNFSGRKLEFNCRVTIRNMSQLQAAENVAVKMSGKDVNSIFMKGFDPFYDSDLLPSNGSHTINPDSELDFVFPTQFNSLLKAFRFSVKLGATQPFCVTASSSNSQPSRCDFVLSKNPGDRTGVKIEKCESESQSLPISATISSNVQT